jgi:hypothetical protein
VPTGGDFDLPDLGAWGQQTCNESGTWGACAKAATTPPGCSGTIFSSSCCQTSGACCEVFDDEDADPVSVNCPQPSCVPRAPSPGTDGNGL